MKSNDTMFEEIVQKRDRLDAARRRRKRTAAAILLPVLILALALPFALRGKTDRPPVQSPTRTDTAKTDAEPGSTDPSALSSPGGKADYTALTGGALPVYTGGGLTAMAPFDEHMLTGTALVFEGTVLETYTADHTYVVLAPGKFGAETMTITTPLKSSVTVFRIERVFHGDNAFTGQTLTLEDKLFCADGHFGYRVGTTYVLGAVDLGEDAAIDHPDGEETLLSGDLSRRSRYATMYSACVPPIEKTAAGDGYIVPDCWSHLTQKSDADVVLAEDALTTALPGADTVTLPPEASAGDDAYVAMSPRGDGVPFAVEFYCKHMKLVPGAEFAARFDALLDALFAVSR